MAANVRIVDRGWNKISNDARMLNRRGVKVGILSGGPSQNGVRVVDYASYSEFGTDKIPSRPFMRKTGDDAERPFQTFAVSLAGRMIEGELTPDQVLDTLGLWYQMRIRATIRSSPSWAKPNAPMTIALKGSSVPLIDNAILLGAINYEKTRL